MWTFSVRRGSLCAYPAHGCSSQRCGNSASCWSFWSRGGHRPDAAACSADVPECTLPACRGNMLHGSAGGKATCHFTHSKLREVKHHVTPVISEFFQPHRLRVEDKSKTCSSSNAHKGLQHLKLYSRNRRLQPDTHTALVSVANPPFITPVQC